MLYTDANPSSASDDKPAQNDDDIVLEAVERFKACKDWQGTEDERSREDIKFANADPRNRWQWDQQLYDARDEEDLPCLTINETRVHNDLIINAMSKNAYGVKVRPTGGKASYESAQAMMSVIRRIEYISKASAQYRKVAEQQVDGGIGYILIDTDFAHARTMDQDIYLRASHDPTAVYLDPWIKEPDGSDANFGFVFEKLARKDFNRKYPKYKNKVGASPLTSDMSDLALWIDNKSISLVKYFRKNHKEDTLVSYIGSDGETINKLKSEIVDESGQELYDALMDDIDNGVIDGRTRDVLNPDVEWFLIAGNTIVKRGEWAGKYIPICRAVGRELVIDNTLDRKGHTRPLINAQHILNWAASSAVQYMGSGTKSQWLAPVRATDNLDAQWKDANIKNYSVLTYNDIDDAAPLEMQKIEPPQRIDPPVVPPGFLQTLQEADRWMMSISGQFQAQMGENDGQAANSGRGIAERQQQGDTATYHFPEHHSDMKRFVGMQLIDLIPKIYDTKRVLQVMDEQGKKRWLQIDPGMESPIQQLREAVDDEEAVALAFNPAIGEYECVSDPGPDYATQRQEAWNAFSLIMQQNQWVASCAADLLMKAGDFPGAEELAERLQKEIKAIKPYLFDDGKAPQMQQAQQQLQRLVALNTELMNKLALKELALKGKDEKRDIEASRAETDRIKALIDGLSKLSLTPKEEAQMRHELGMATHDATAQLVQQANQAGLDMQSQALGGAIDRHGEQQQAQLGMQSAAQQGEIDARNQAAAAAQSGAMGADEMPPVQGARRAPDGNWYTQGAGGEFYRVERRKKPRAKGKAKPKAE